MSAHIAMPSCLVPGLGVLTTDITPELVDEVTELAGCREQRWRLLPARVAVYFVLGMCLLSGEDSMGPPGYRSVLRTLSHGVRHLAGLALPTRSALCQARERLGSMVFELLLERLAGPLAVQGEAGSFALGLRVVAWDSTSVPLPASAENRAGVGQHCNQLGEGGPPLFRLLALIECGTHAVIDAVFDAFAATSEQVLARRVLASLREGMLLLADRNFPGHELWCLAAATGAELCWRAPGHLTLDVAQQLADGSWLSVLHDPAHGARSRRLLRRRGIIPPGAALVRVIQYKVAATTPDGHSRTECCRLITTMLDTRQAPAGELAVLYHERWECEGQYLDLKARLKGTGFTLRSRTPALAVQEMLAFLCTAQALAALAHRAAATAGVDPGRVSFTVTIRIARDHARTQHQTLTPAGLAAATATAAADILADLLPPRRKRQCPREQKTRTTPFPKGKDPRHPPGTVTYAITIEPPSPNAIT